MIRSTPGRTFAVLALAILGCASCASPRATWYYQSETECVDEVLYLTIVNDLGRPLDVDKVIVSGATGSDEEGWSCTISKTAQSDAERKAKQSAKTLSSGRLMVVPLPISNVPCLVPIAVSLVSAKKTTHIDLPATMPSALPRIWHECPPPWKPEAATKPADTAGGQTGGTEEKACPPKPEPLWTCTPLPESQSAKTL